MSLSALYTYTRVHTPHMYTQSHSQAGTCQCSHAVTSSHAVTIENLATIVVILQRIQILHPDSPTALTFSICFMPVLCAQVYIVYK